MPLKYRYYDEDFKELLLKLTGGDKEDVDDIIYFMEHRGGRLWVFDGWDAFNDIMERAIKGYGDISIFKTVDSDNWYVVEYFTKTDVIEFLNDVVHNGELRLDSGSKSLVRIPFNDRPKKISTLKVIEVPKFPSVAGFTNDSNLRDEVEDELYDGEKAHVSSTGVYVLWYILDNDATTFYFCKKKSVYTISIMSPNEMAKFIGDTLESIENER